MLWKVIKSVKYNKLGDCLKELKKKYKISPWIEDIIKRNKNKKFNKNKILKLYKIKVANLGFKKPVALKKIYKKFSKFGFLPVPMQYAIYCRFLYNEQPKLEWLRIATPLESMVDSDKVPHLPKLGRALRSYFLETYWSYPNAVFHPHNYFVVLKK